MFTDAFTAADVKELRTKWTSSQFISGKYLSLIKFFNGENVVAEALLIN